jgi:NTP pyrophosphatase (non-canonical NTP hydrolase)
MIEAVTAINQGLARKFPHGNNPYQIMTRLLEEAGELAQQVNHFENSGVKRDKHGEPDRARMAQEVKVFC